MDQRIMFLIIVSTGFTMLAAMLPMFFMILFTVIRQHHVRTATQHQLSTASSGTDA